MALLVNTGFIGLATIGTNHLRCSDFSLNPSQDLSFYNHVIGLNDTIPEDSVTKGETVGAIQTQRTFWRPSPIAISGSMSFPAAGDEDGVVNFENLFNYAKYGNYFDLEFNYYCKAGRSFTNCRIASFGFSVTASDIVSITSDIHAKDFTDIMAGKKEESPQKLLTWDTVSVTNSIFGSNVYGINFNINNNLSEIYSAKPEADIDPLSYKNFLPRDLRLGTQEVTGTMQIFVKEGQDFLTPITGQSVIGLTCAGFTTNINVIFKPKQISGIIGPVIVDIPFVGVDKAFGD